MVDPDLVQVLQDLVARMDALSAKVDKLVPAVTPVPVPDPPQSGSVDWLKIIKRAPLEEPQAPMTGFDPFVFCNLAWNGFTSLGTRVRSGQILEDSKHTVKTIVTEAAFWITDAKELSPRQKQAVREYRANRIGVIKGKLEAIAINYDIDSVSELDGLHCKDLLYTAIRANVHPDVFYCTLLVGPVDQWQPDPVFGVVGPSCVVYWKDRDLQSLWDAEHPGQSGGPSGDPGEE